MKIFKYLVSLFLSNMSKVKSAIFFIVGYITALIIRHYFSNILFYLLYLLILTAGMIIWNILRKTFKKKYKKKVECLVAFIFMSLNMSSQVNDGHMVTNIVDFSSYITPEGGILWKVTGNGLKKESYLLGTYHDSSHSFTMNQVLSIPGINEALRQVDEIALESNLSALDNTKKSSAIRGEYQLITPSVITRMPKNTYYSSFFKGYDEWRNFDAKMRKHGLSNISEQKPRYWLNILKFMYIPRLPRNPQESQPVISVDKRIAQYANENSKSLFYLDTWRSEFNSKLLGIADIYFSTSNDTLEYKKPLKEQLSALLAYIDTIDSPAFKKKNEEACKRMQEEYIKNVQIGKVLEDSLFSAYKLMNLKKIEDVDLLFIKQYGIEASGNTTKEGYLSRNAYWIPIIEEHASRCACLIAVGCRHLPGQGGVINLLRKKGYTVTPVY